jgi:hypothetical protein
MMRRAFLIILLLLPGLAAAQEPSSANAAVIRGRVVDAEGRPLAGADVSINFRPPPGSPNRGGIVLGTGVVSDTPWGKLRVTDEDGRFEAAGLEAGQHLVLVRARGYLSSGSVTVTLKAGEQRNDLTVQMLPEASISGVVFDDRNEPLVRAQVQVFRRTVASGRVTWREWLQPRETDDRGIFRLGGLRAGEYLVALLEAPAEGRPAMYFPGVPTPDGAEVLALRTGEHRAGVNFTLRSGLRMAPVSGRVAGGPASLPNLTVQLDPVGASPGGLAALRAEAASSGVFTFSNVPFGTYRLRAWAFPNDPGLVLVPRRSFLPPDARNRVLSSPSGAPTWVGDISVTVDDAPNDVVVPLAPAARAIGRITVDPAATGLPRELLPRVPVVFWPVEGSLGPVPAGGIGADGRFASVGLPAGKYQVWLGITLVPGLADWYAVSFGGRPSSVVELGSKDVSVDITITNRLTEISGTVVAEGRARPGSIIVVFNADPQLWTEVSPRRVVADDSGRFVVPRLRAGDYYAVAVVKTPELWEVPEYLSSLVGSAALVSLEVGGTRNLELALTDR